MTPLRPWEWANLAGDDAVFWLECVAISNAVAEGVRAARSEKGGYERAQRFDTDEVGEAG